ncbi:hypothetical protein ACCO45_009867 [Purpureocillium lilacinum]|uniref:Uncharacterized protein n=1 Tax=Purpureocillium lilacinum TaxID=33203 RepID=A0ACC4DIL4_PURLI
MSGIEVVGLISAIISLVGAVENIYSGFRDARNLPRAFREVAEKLPLVRETLRIAEQQIKSTSDEEACEAIKTVVENCKVKAERLKEIFTTVAPPILPPGSNATVLEEKKGGRAKGTCEWILGTDQLTAWLDDAAESTSPPTDLLWLHGNPGAGKSTMSMFLVEALSENFAKSRNKTLAYFFCDSGYDTRKTATAVVRGLLLQLVQQHPRLIDYVLPTYEARRTRAFDSFDALWTMFTNACADRATGRKYCVVDALDECEHEEQKTLLKHIEETFGRDRSVNELNFGILITSRPRDIHKFIKEKVAELSKKKSYPSSVAGDVTQILHDGAGGIFLWVGLACQELEDVASKDAVRRLKNIPKGLNSIYEQLLEEALGRDEDPAAIKRLLGFVMVARRPLSTWELASACQLYQDADYHERVQFTIDSIAACRLMVVVQDGTVSLLHQSVRDFLGSNARNVGCFISELEAHDRLASRCVDYLTARCALPGGNAGPQDDFGSYSTQFWPGHAHLAKDQFRIRDDQDEFFAVVSRTRDSWWREFRLKHNVSIFHVAEPSTVSIFHVAAKWGIPLLVDYALSLKDRASRFTAPFSVYVDSACRDSNGITPLSQCATSGHAQVFSAMLQRTDHKSHVEGTVIYEAARYEEHGAGPMDVLLDIRGDQVTITEDIVKAAAGNWESGPDVMKVRLDRKGRPGHDHGGYCQGRGWKLESGPEVMKAILDRQGDTVTITEGSVKAAAGNWRSAPELMKIVLDRRGSQLNITDAAVSAISKLFSGSRNDGSGKAMLKLA